MYNWGVQPNGKINDASLYAKCKGAVCTIKVSPLLPGGDYRVIDTDYTSYAIVSSCTPQLFGLFHYQTIWILGRSNNYDDTAQRAYVDSLGFYSISRLINPVQGAQCNYPV